jgi:hypothetical protein
VGADPFAVEVAVLVGGEEVGGEGLDVVSPHEGSLVTSSEDGDWWWYLGVG